MCSSDLASTDNASCSARGSSALVHIRDILIITIKTLFLSCDICTHALSIVAGVITLQFGDEVVNNEDITQKVQQKKL